MVIRRLGNFSADSGSEDDDTSNYDDDYHDVDIDDDDSENDSHDNSAALSQNNRMWAHPITANRMPVSRENLDDQSDHGSVQSAAMSIQSGFSSLFSGFNKTSKPARSKEGSRISKKHPWEMKGALEPVHHARERGLEPGSIVSARPRPVAAAKPEQKSWDHHAGSVRSEHRSVYPQFEAHPPTRTRRRVSNPETHYLPTNSSLVVKTATKMRRNSMSLDTMPTMEPIQSSGKASPKRTSLFDTFADYVLGPIDEPMHQKKEPEHQFFRTSENHFDAKTGYIVPETKPAASLTLASLFRLQEEEVTETRHDVVVKEVIETNRKTQKVVNRTSFEIDAPRGGLGRNPTMPHMDRNNNWMEAKTGQQLDPNSESEESESENESVASGFGFDEKSLEGDYATAVDELFHNEDLDDPDDLDFGESNTDLHKSVLDRENLEDLEDLDHAEAVLLTFQDMLNKAELDEQERLRILDHRIEMGSLPSLESADPSVDSLSDNDDDSDGGHALFEFLETFLDDFEEDLKKPKAKNVFELFQWSDKKNVDVLIEKKEEEIPQEIVVGEEEQFGFGFTPNPLSTLHNVAGSLVPGVLQPSRNTDALEEPENSLFGSWDKVDTPKHPMLSTKSVSLDDGWATLLDEKKDEKQSSVDHSEFSKLAFGATSSVTDVALAPLALASSKPKIEKNPPKDASFKGSQRPSLDSISERKRLKGNEALIESTSVTEMKLEEIKTSSPPTSSPINASYKATKGVFKEFKPQLSQPSVKLANRNLEAVIEPSGTDLGRCFEANEVLPMEEKTEWRQQTQAAQDLKSNSKLTTPDVAIVKAKTADQVVVNEQKPVFSKRHRKNEVNQLLLKSPPLARQARGVSIKANERKISAIPEPTGGNAEQDSDSVDNSSVPLTSQPLARQERDRLVEERLEPEDKIGELKSSMDSPSGFSSASKRIVLTARVESNAVGESPKSSKTPATSKELNATTMYKAKLRDLGKARQSERQQTVIPVIEDLLMHGKEEVEKPKCRKDRLLTSDEALQPDLRSPAGIQERDLEAEVTFSSREGNSLKSSTRTSKKGPDPSVQPQNMLSLKELYNVDSIIEMSMKRRNSVDRKIQPSGEEAGVEKIRDEERILPTKNDWDTPLSQEESNSSKGMPNVTSDSPESPSFIKTIEPSNSTRVGDDKSAEKIVVLPLLSPNLELQLAPKSNAMRLALAAKEREKSPKRFSMIDEVIPSRQRGAKHNEGDKKPTLQMTESLLTRKTTKRMVDEKKFGDDEEGNKQVDDKTVGQKPNKPLQSELLALLYSGKYSDTVESKDAKMKKKCSSKSIDLKKEYKDAGAVKEEDISDSGSLRKAWRKAHKDKNEFTKDNGASDNDFVPTRKTKKILKLDQTIATNFDIEEQSLDPLVVLQAERAMRESKPKKAKKSSEVKDRVHSPDDSSHSKKKKKKKSETGNEADMTDCSMYSQSSSDRKKSKKKKMTKESDTPVQLKKRDHLAVHGKKTEPLDLRGDGDLKLSQQESEPKIQSKSLKSIHSSSNDTEVPLKKRRSRASSVPRTMELPQHIQSIDVLADDIDPKRSTKARSASPRTVEGSHRLKPSKRPITQSIAASGSRVSSSQRTSPMKQNSEDSIDISPPVFRKAPSRGKPDGKTSTFLDTKSPADDAVGSDENKEKKSRRERD